MWPSIKIGDFGGIAKALATSMGPAVTASPMGASFRADFEGRDLSSEETIRALDEWVMTRLREAFEGEGETKTTFFCLATRNPNGPRFPATPWGILMVDGDGDPPEHMRFLFLKAARDYMALGIYFAAQQAGAVYLTREHRGVGNRAWRASIEGTKLGAFESAPPQFSGFLDFPAGPN